MTKTYQTIRSDLARRYRDKLKNVHETLDILAKGGAKEIIGKTRNTLLTNLSDSLTQEEGYKEAKQAHDAERHHLEKNRTTSEESLDGSFLQLYKRKVETAKALGQRAEENNIKDPWGDKLSFRPETLSFDGEVVLDSPEGGIARLFSVKDSGIQEIPLLPNVINLQPDEEGSIYGPRPSSVSKLTPGFFVVKVSDTRPDIRPGGNKSGYIVVDTSGRAVTPNFSYISDMWKFKGFFYAEQENSDKTKTAIIYDDTMHALFHLPIKGNHMENTIEYCDKQACIQKDGWQKGGWKYRIFDQTGLIAEGDEEELSTNEHFQRFLSHQQEQEQERKRQEANQQDSLTTLESLSHITHCTIKYRGDAKNDAYIENDKGMVLYDIGGSFSQIDYRANNHIFKSSDGIIMQVEDLGRTSNLLKIQPNYLENNFIFINKDTGKQLIVKQTPRLKSGKFLEVFKHSYEDAEIYDENLNKLGDELWSYGSLHAILIEEDGEKKAYLYSSITGKRLCEIDKECTKWGCIKDNHANTYVVQQKDGTLCEIKTD